MKFLHLKEALDRVEILTSDQQQQPNSQGANFSEKKIALFWNGYQFSAESLKAKVVTDRIIRDPIDRLAAIVTSKTPWWAKPLYETRICNNHTKPKECFKRKKIFAPKGNRRPKTSQKVEKTTGIEKAIAQNTAPDRQAKEPTFSEKDISNIIEAMTKGLVQGQFTPDEVETTIKLLSNETLRRSARKH